MDETPSRLPDHIDQIIAAIDRIRSYIDGVNSASFSQNTLIQDAVIRNLEVIGEAAGRIQVSDPALRSATGI